MQLAPPLPWVAVVGIAAALGYRLGGMRLALLAGGAFLYLAVFGQWASAMTTLLNDCNFISCLRLFGGRHRRVAARNGTMFKSVN